MTTPAETLDISSPMRGWHFTESPTKFRGGRAIPPDDRWLYFPGAVSICNSGLHFSRRAIDALGYAPGNYAHLIEAAGIVTDDGDKCVCRARRIVARCDAEQLLRLFARQQALSVAHRWEMPPAVREFLTTGDEKLRSAACSAARSAACSAADSAARSAADVMLSKMLLEATA